MTSSSLSETERLSHLYSPVGRCNPHPWSARKFDSSSSSNRSSSKNEDITNNNNKNTNPNHRHNIPTSADRTEASPVQFFRRKRRGCVQAGHLRARVEYIVRVEAQPVFVRAYDRLTSVSKGEMEFQQNSCRTVTSSMKTLQRKLQGASARCGTQICLSVHINSVIPKLDTRSVRIW